MSKGLKIRIVKSINFRSIKISRSLRKLYNAELHNIYSTHNISLTW
jgi:hypothetical protein